MLISQMWEIACFLPPFPRMGIYSNIFHSLNKYVLSAFYCEVFVFGIEDTAVNITRIPTFLELAF